MSKLAAERFALENDLYLDEVVNYFRGVELEEESD